MLCATASGIIINSGFETGDFTGWDLSSYSNITISSDEKHSGSYSAKFHAFASGDGYLSLGQVPTPYPSNVSGYSFWYKIDFVNGSKHEFEYDIIFYDIPQITDVKTNVSGWTQISGNIENSGILLYVEFSADATIGPDSELIVYLDDIEFWYVDANFTANKTVGCSPLSVGFTDESTGVVTGWSWDVDGDGSEDYTTQNVSHEYSSPGIYTVNLTVTNTGVSDSEVKTDYITVASQPISDFTSNVTSGYPGFPVQFTNQSYTDITGWYWDFGDGETSTDENPIHWYNVTIGNTPTSYTVGLNVTKLDGYAWENKTNFIVAYPLESNFTSDYAPAAAPLTVHFTDTTTNGTPTSWFWDFGDSTNSTSQNPTKIYTMAGIYTVTLNASNDYSYDTETKTNYIDVLATSLVPVVSFSATPREGTYPLTVEFTDTSTGAPTSWSWAYRKPGGSWTEFNTTENPTTIFTSAGLYSIRLNATNVHGTGTKTEVHYIAVDTGVMFDSFNSYGYNYDAVRPVISSTGDYSIYTLYPEQNGVVQGNLNFAFYPKVEMVHAYKDIITGQFYGGAYMASQPSTSVRALYTTDRVTASYYAATINGSYYHLYFPYTNLGSQYDPTYQYYFTLFATQIRADAQGRWTGLYGTPVVTSVTPVTLNIPRDSYVRTWHPDAGGHLTIDMYSNASYRIEFYVSGTTWQCYSNGVLLSSGTLPYLAVRQDGTPITTSGRVTPNTAGYGYKTTTVQLPQGTSIYGWSNSEYVLLDDIVTGWFPTRSASVGGLPDGWSVVGDLFGSGQSGVYTDRGVKVYDHEMHFTYSNANNGMTIYITSPEGVDIDTRSVTGYSGVTTYNITELFSGQPFGSYVVSTSDGFFDYFNYIAGSFDTDTAISWSVPSAVSNDVVNITYSIDATQWDVDEYDYFVRVYKPSRDLVEEYPVTSVTAPSNVSFQVALSYANGYTSSGSYSAEIYVYDKDTGVYSLVTNSLLSFVYGNTIPHIGTAVWGSVALCGDGGNITGTPTVTLELNGTEQTYNPGEDGLFLFDMLEPETQYNITLQISGGGNYSDVSSTVTTGIINSLTWIDLCADPVYTLSLDIYDISTAAKILSPVTIIISTGGAQFATQVTTTGSATFSLPEDDYSISLSASGYQAYTATFTITADMSSPVYMQPQQSYSGIEYSIPPRSVRFVCQDTFGTRLNNVQVTATGHATSLPDWGILSVIFGWVVTYTDSSASLSNDTMSGYTGNDGVVTFMMTDILQYEMHFVDASRSINDTLRITPKDDTYIITLGTKPFVAQYEWVNITMYTEDTNSSYATLYGDYSDPNLHTISTTFYVWNATGVLLYQNERTGENSFTESYAVPHRSGSQYRWAIVANQSDYGTITRYGAVTLHSRIIELGLEEMYYTWISLILLFLLLPMFSGRNAQYGYVIIPLIGGVFWYIGWLPVTYLLITGAIILGIIMYLSKRKAQGEGT